MGKNLLNKESLIKRITKFSKVFITSLLVLVSFHPFLTPRLAYADNTTTYNQAVSLIQRSGDAIISGDPVSNPDSQNPYQTLSYDCSALYEGATALQGIDSTRVSSFQTYAKSIADYLVTHKDDLNEGLTGWGLSYAWDAFQDGTTNPAFTKYAFQTSIAGRCLLDAYTATGNNTYLQTTEDAITSFQNASTATTFNDPSCSNCFYFGYSLNANDNGRLVKNTNMSMAMVVSKLSKITGNSSYTTLANTLFKTEEYEIDIRTNYNYLGFNDPFYAANQDSHQVAELWGIEDLGLNVSGLSYQTPLINLKRAFWKCGSACSATTNSDYGIFAGCYLASEDSLSKSNCVTSINTYASSTLDGYALISVIKSLSIFNVTPTPTPTNIPGNSYNTTTPTPTPIPGNFFTSSNAENSYSLYIPEGRQTPTITNQPSVNEDTLQQPTEKPLPIPTNHSPSTVISVLQNIQQLIKNIWQIMFY